MNSPVWGFEHRASNPVSVKNLTAIETSTIVKFLRLYDPVGTKRTIKYVLSLPISLRVTRPNTHKEITAPHRLPSKIP
jgi:hypothetical protein